MHTHRPRPRPATPPAAAPVAGRGRLDRPLGLPPRGSRYGFLGLMGLGVVTPMLGGLALGVLFHAPADPGAGVLVPFFGWLALLIAAFTGMAMRRFWGICLGWGMGLLLALAYPPVLAAAALIPLGVVPAGGDRHFLAVYALVWLVAVLPLWFLLVRLLRLRFWQPWRRPDEWEVGDERAPRWALTVLGATKPWLLDDIRRAEGLPPQPPARWQRWVAVAVAVLVGGRVLLAVLG